MNNVQSFSDIQIEQDYGQIVKSGKTSKIMIHELARKKDDKVSEGIYLS